MQRTHAAFAVALQRLQGEEETEKIFRRASTDADDAGAVVAKEITADGPLLERLQTLHTNLQGDFKPAHNRKYGQLAGFLCWERGTPRWLTIAQLVELITSEKGTRKTRLSQGWGGMHYPVATSASHKRSDTDSRTNPTMMNFERCKTVPVVLNLEFLEFQVEAREVGRHERVPRDS